MYQEMYVVQMIDVEKCEDGARKFWPAKMWTRDTLDGANDLYMHLLHRMEEGDMPPMMLVMHDREVAIRHERCTLEEACKHGYQGSPNRLFEPTLEPALRKRLHME